MLFKLYQYIHQHPILLSFVDNFSRIYRAIKVRKIHPSLCENLEGFVNYNINKSWFNQEKKVGISGVARLKNGEDFLEKVVESYVDYLDEIILVDNNSHDNTMNICRKLQKKYKDKIKIYQYEHEVVGPLTNNPPSTRSVFSLAYYYNWCFSKSQYKYVMKIDDDNLMIPHRMAKIRRYILQNKPNRFTLFHGINLSRNDKKLVAPRDDMFAGRYGDHGIYPVSTRTYYEQKDRCEILRHPYKYKRKGLAYFHLKYLKKDKGCSNYGDHGKSEENIKSFENFSNIESLAQVDDISFLTKLIS